MHDLAYQNYSYQICYVMLTTRYLITFLSLAYRPEQLLFPHPIARAARKALAQAANLEYKNRGTG